MSGLRWRKLGQVFDPAVHGLPESCIGWAQSPQTLVFDDYVRVYFSTRMVDPANGKYISRVACVDLDRDLRVIRVAQRPVIEPGRLGTFDEHGIFPMNVVRHHGKVLGYTCGWSRRVSVSVETAIGLAVSEDGGESFQRVGDGPVLSASLHEPYLVGDGFVKIVDDVFHMWYIFGTGWSRATDDAAPDRIYKIGYARSSDGIEWTRPYDGQAIISDRLGPTECQALPTVERIGGRYCMAFCYREQFGFRHEPGRGYRLGYAWSDDLTHWSRDDASIAMSMEPGAWDAEMMCYPHLFEWHGRVYLLYNGNQFGRHGFGAAVLDG